MPRRRRFSRGRGTGLSVGDNVRRVVVPVSVGGAAAACVGGLWLDAGERRWMDVGGPGHGGWMFIGGGGGTSRRFNGGWMFIGGGGGTSRRSSLGGWMFIGGGGGTSRVHRWRRRGVFIPVVANYYISGRKNIIPVSQYLPLFADLADFRSFSQEFFWSSRGGGDVQYVCGESPAGGCAGAPRSGLRGREG